MRRIPVLLLVLATLAQPVSAQSIRLGVSAETADGSLRYDGSARLNLLTRSAKIKGKTSRGDICEGTAQVTADLAQGQGQLACADGVTATFSFNILSRVPITGEGVAELNDGRKARLRIFR